MPSPLATSTRLSLSIRITLIALLTMLLSGWTCSVFFVSCQGLGAQPQVTSLSPNTIPSDAESVLLTVGGSGFTSQSLIMWNGNALQTTFIDSHHIQTLITPQIFGSFGGSAGNDVQISVRSQESVNHSGCPGDGNSASFALVIS